MPVGSGVDCDMGREDGIMAGGSSYQLTRDGRQVFAQCWVNIADIRTTIVQSYKRDIEKLSHLTDPFGHGVPMSKTMEQHIASIMCLCKNTALQSQEK